MFETTTERDRLVECAEAQQAIEQFDEWDDAIMHDILGNARLAKPVQALLIAHSEIKTTLGSFGINDAQKVLLLLLPMLDKLRDACIEEWSES